MARRLSPVLQAIGRGFKAYTTGAGVGGGFGFRGLREGGLDYRAEAGALIDSSVVFPVVNFGVLQLLKAPIVHLRPKGEQFERVPNSPLEKLLTAPTPWYDGLSLRTAWTTALMLSGNTYCLKRRSAAGVLRGLEFLPLHSCWPESRPGSGEFISYYRLSLPSGHWGVEPKDVLHMRWHVPDPWRPGMGFAPLSSCYPEIARDKRAARYEDSILRRGGKAHLLSPDGKDEDGNPLTFGPSQAAEFLELIEACTTGDNAGSTTVLPYSVRVQQMGFSPADLALEHQHDLSEERVCASFNLPPVVVCFGTGLDSQNNRASYSAALLQAYIGFTRPLMIWLGHQLTGLLVPELGEAGDVLAYRLDDIPEERQLRSESDQRDAGGPTYTVNEVRQRRGDDPVDGGNVIRGSRSTGQPRRTGNENGQ